MHPRFRLGLRTVKTALSVMISLYIASFFGELSIFPALASVSVMSRTFDEGLLECRNQAVGICIGGLFGCATAYLIEQPPIWVMGLGVMLIIFLCSSFNVGFSCSLSCAIFIVACMTEQSQVGRNVLIRLQHTAIGLATGLTINYAIVPYNNNVKIYELLEDLTDLIPKLLGNRFLEGQIPDLTPMDGLMDRLEYEMTIYRHQRFRRKRFRTEIYHHMADCFHLAKEIHQELRVLCSISAICLPTPDQWIELQCIGLAAPESFPCTQASTKEEQSVTVYHLNRLLEARSSLVCLLQDQA